MIIMLGVFLAVGSMIVIIEHVFNNFYDGWKENLLIASSILIPATIVIGMLALNYHMCAKDEIVERIDIYAGYNDSEISGRWFLLSGRVDEEDVVYYWVNDSGVKSKHSQFMDDSVFIEDGGEYLLLRREACPEGWRWLFYCDDVTAEFHVPENSIIQMYRYQ